MCLNKTAVLSCSGNQQIVFTSH